MKFFRILHKKVWIRVEPLLLQYLHSRTLRPVIFQVSPRSMSLPSFLSVLESSYSVSASESESEEKNESESDSASWGNKSSTEEEQKCLRKSKLYHSSSCSAGNWSSSSCARARYLNLRFTKKSGNTKTETRQLGQQKLCRNQALRHRSWNLWPHGSLRMVLPGSIASRQIEHCSSQFFSSNTVQGSEWKFTCTDFIVGLGKKNTK